MKRITRYKKNSLFNKTLINIIYQFSCDNSEIMAYTILSRLLAKTNKKYNNESSFTKEKLNRYIISYNVVNQCINNVYFINFSLLIPNTDILSDISLESQIQFLLDTIYDNNLNDLNLFLKEKKLYTEYLLNNYKNIEFIAEKNVLDILDKDGIFNKFRYKDIDNINSLKLDDVISFYNKYILNIKPCIFVNGSIDFNILDNIFDNYLCNKKLHKNSVIKDYNIFYNNDNLKSNVIDKSNFYQSIVYMVYKIEEYTIDDFYKLQLLQLLLSSPSSDLLLNNLRKKNNIVYSCSSNILIRNGLLLIKVLVNKNNIILIKKIIHELLLSLKNIGVYEDNIKNIINNYEINIEREKDDFFVLSNNIINKYYNTDITSSEELKILKNISVNDLKDFIDRLHFICDYTLEGDL